ncbi:MAG TPA: hypothetical protein VFE61_04020 [Candidatus Sulfotelmatobacter sp.]|nr:hypothetical protein [Candidatus Sulfotelmatobacter sp.]
MCRPSRIFFVFVCLLLAAPVWAQGSPVVYVSTGTTILSITTATGAVSTPALVTNAAAVYEGLVVGPNNDPNTSVAHPYLLYACDPTHNTIIRVDPNDVAAGTDTVYMGTGAAHTLQQPQCGWFDSAGDLIVNSEVAGSGAWKIPGVLSLPLGTATASFAPPTQLNTELSAAQTGQGITQKYVGDLLAVDQAGKQVVRSTIQLPASNSGYSFGPSSGFITKDLSSPVGIARNNAGQVYVSDHTSNKKGVVQLFDSTGTFVSTCVSTSKFGNQQPNLLGIAEDGTLYVASAGSSSGAVWQVTRSAGACTATQLATTTALSPLTGIALPPTTVTIEANQAGTGTLSFNYGSSLFDVTTGACDLTVTKSLVPASQITTLAEAVSGNATIDGGQVTVNGGVSAPYLGDRGFATKYTAVSTVLSPDSCPPQPFGFLIAAFVDQLKFTNPWIITCAPPNSCAATDVHGIYFLGGFLPDDLGTSGTGGHHSDFFVASMNLNGGEPATLSLESPLTQVNPPQLAGTFSSGSTLSAKFKFTPTITDAVVILAVAQVCQPGTTSVNDPVCGPNGQASVSPINVINIGAEGSSTTPPPTFKFSATKQQYELSLSLKGYAPGIYSLSFIVLNNFTAPVTVIVKIM